MRKSYSLLIIFSVAILCQSCSVPDNDRSAAAQKDSHVYTQCTEPRPEICTREYNPVCATLSTGSEEKTFATGCTACADPSVIKYRQGPCEP